MRIERCGNIKNDISVNKVGEKKNENRKFSPKLRFNLVKKINFKYFKNQQR